MVGCALKQNLMVFVTTNVLGQVDDLLFVSYDPTTGMKELLQQKGIKLKNNNCIADSLTYWHSQVKYEFRTRMQ